MRVSQFLIILPVALQVIVTFILFGFHWRTRLAGEGSNRFTEVYRAQFELPVLFYGAALFGYAMRIIDPWHLFFAVLFVLAQVTEAGGVLVLNSGGVRTAAVLVAAFAVLGMWLMIAAHFSVAGF